jgi:hypothetical protein
MDIKGMHQQRYHEKHEKHQVWRLFRRFPTSTSPFASRSLPGFTFPQGPIKTCRDLLMWMVTICKSCASHEWIIASRGMKRETPGDQKYILAHCREVSLLPWAQMCYQSCTDNQKKYIYINKECCRSVIRYTHQNRTSRLQPWKLTKIAFSSRIFLDQEWKCWQTWRRGAYRNQRSKWSCCKCSEFSWSLRSMLSS